MRRAIRWSAIWLDETGKLKRYDCVHASWTKVAKKMGLEKMRLGLKHLRKTSSTALGQHPQFKYYAAYFLADSPKGMDQRHYVRPSEEEFFSALDWLRGQLLAT